MPDVGHSVHVERELIDGGEITAAGPAIRIGDVHALGFDMRDGSETDMKVGDADRPPQRRTGLAVHERNEPIPTEQEHAG